MYQFYVSTSKYQDNNIDLSISLCIQTHHQKAENQNQQLLLYVHIVVQDENMVVINISIMHFHHSIQYYYFIHFYQNYQHPMYISQPSTNYSHTYKNTILIQTIMMQYMIFHHIYILCHMLNCNTCHRQNNLVGSNMCLLGFKGLVILLLC